MLYGDGNLGLAHACIYFMKMEDGIMHHVFGFCAFSCVDELKEVNLSETLIKTMFELG